MSFNSVFNVDKSLESYKKPELVLGDEPGLFDTVNKHYPKIWSLYKEMKSLDWSEDEFDYTQCNIDFKTCSPEVAAVMIKTLAWQWEADSIASRSIITVLAPFITSSELWAAWLEVAKSEVVHAATYSEIVRMSFDNPEEVLAEILSVKENLSRLDTVAKMFAEAHTVGHEYALGIRKNDQDTYNTVFATVATLYILERFQFMDSFANTFTICSSGLFQPIGKAVQKICQDEFEVHCELDKEVLIQMMATERGRIAMETVKPRIREIFIEVVESELKWLDYTFDYGRIQIPGATCDLIKKWALFNAKAVDTFLQLDTDYDFPDHNPMPGLEPWINMNKTQAAPQEQDLAAYKVASIRNDDEGADFECDF